jgi:hypothetical protein
MTGSTEARGDKELIGELDKLYTALQQDRKPFESVWSEVTDMFYSKRNIYRPNNDTQDRKPTHRYSSRAKRALAIASRGFQGYTADRRSDWLQLQFEDHTLMGMYGVQDWLEVSQRILLAHFSRSGFYEKLAEMIPDAMSMGTGAIYSEEDVERHKIVFRCRHPRAIYISENSFEEVKIVIDEEYMSYRSLKDRFGELLHNNMLEREKTTPFASTTILHITMPFDGRFAKYASGPRSKAMQFISIWYDKDNSHIIDVGGYFEFPYAIWRYDKSDGEAYGYCPGFDVIDDVYMANQMSRTRIQLGNLIADPPMIVDEELEGSDFIVPGYHAYRTKKDSTMDPVALGANYPIATDNEDRIEAAIDAHFNVPVYQMLQQLEARNKTATEVIEIAGERVAVLGPTVGQFELEALQPLVRRSFNLLRRAGLIPPPPQAVMEAIQSGQTLKVEFLGRLSQIQRRYYKTDGLNQVFGYIAPIQQVNPEALDNIDFDALTRESLESAGAPASVVRELEDVEKIRATREQKQAELIQKQELLSQEQMLAKNADKLGKRPEAGSPLENMGKMNG